MGIPDGEGADREPGRQMNQPVDRRRKAREVYAEAIVASRGLAIDAAIRAVAQAHEEFKAAIIAIEAKEQQDAAGAPPEST